MTRLTRPIQLSATIVVALALLLVTTAGGAPVSAYSVSSEPAAVKPATPFTYTIRLTNNADSPERAQRARIGIPAGFSVVSLSAATSAAGTCVVSTWIAGEIVNGIVEVKKPSGSTTELCPGGTLTVSIRTSAPTEGIWTWTTELLRETAFALQGSQPTVRVDGTPPVVSIDESPGNPSNDSSPTFGFFADEPGVSFGCKLDDGPVEPCSSPRAYAGLLDGPHSFQVHATDAVGNEGSPAGYAWTVDRVPPTPTIAQPVDGSSTNDTTPAFSGTAGAAATDSPAIEVRIHAGSNTAGPLLQTFLVTRSGATWAREPAALDDGVYTARAGQTDAAGNTGYSAPTTFTVDTGGPGTTITEKPASPAVSPTATFGFTSNDPGATFRCRLDLAAFVACASPITYEGLSPGAHVFMVNASDRAGNTGGNATYSWTVLAPPPPAATPPTPPPAGQPPGRDVVPPHDVTNVRVKAANGVVTLRWALPADPDFERVSVTRTAAGKNVRAATLYQGRARSLTDRKVKNGVRYRYRITSHDRAGNASAGVAVAARPQAPLIAPIDGASVTAPPVLRWQAAPRATYYNVQLWLQRASGQQQAVRPVKVLSAWPAAPRLKLTARWTYEGNVYRLVPGTYRWYVFPGFGKLSQARYGALLGQSAFTVKGRKAL